MNDAHQFGRPSPAPVLRRAVLSLLTLLLAAALLLLFLGVWGKPEAVHAAQPTGKVVGLIQVEATEWLAEINPVTGSIIPYGAGIDNCCFAVSLNSALDPDHGRLFAIMRRLDEFAPRLFTFDLATGSGQASPPLTTTPGVNFLTYDPAGDQLLALTYDVAADHTQLVRVDQVSGGFTPIGPGLPACCALQTLDIGYDRAARTLLAALSPTGFSTITLYAIDVVSGLITTTVELPSSLYAVNYLTFDNITPTLWSLVQGKQDAFAERLAVIDPASGAIMPRGAGIPDCCGLRAGGVALNTEDQVLIAPLETFDGIPFFAGYALATGEVLYQTPFFGANVHYVKYYTPPVTEQPPIRLYLPAVLRSE